MHKLKTYINECKTTSKCLVAYFKIIWVDENINNDENNDLFEEL